MEESLQRSVYDVYSVVVKCWVALYMLLSDQRLYITHYTSSDFNVKDEKVKIKSEKWKWGEGQVEVFIVLNIANIVNMKTSLFLLSKQEMARNDSP